MPSLSKLQMTTFKKGIYLLLERIMVHQIEGRNLASRSSKNVHIAETASRNIYPDAVSLFSGLRLTLSPAWEAL